MTTIINAAFRLRATIVEAMAGTRKEAMTFLIKSTMATSLFKHYILVHELPERQELAHWQKECRNFLFTMLESTIIKSGVLKKEDYMHVLWNNIAKEFSDIQRYANSIIGDENVNDSERSRILTNNIYHAISVDYKDWLSKWYDYYHNPHADKKYKHTLPPSLF